MKYELQYSVLESKLKLSDSQLIALSGAFEGTLSTLLSVEGLPKLRCWLDDYVNYFYVPHLGLCHNSRWQEFLPQDFLDCKETITQVCVEYEVPRSFARFLNQDESFKAFVNSPKYKHLLGVLNHTKHTNYGTITNQRKTNNVRHCDRSDVSWNRVEGLLKEYNLTLLESWEGTRTKEGKVRFYKVRCNDCGCEYETYMHSRDLRVCPNCKVGSYSAIRESKVKAFIEERGLKVYQNYRLLIKSGKGLPMELDVYVPEKKVAFEFNGYRWHCSAYKDKYYHKYKTERCLEEGVKLYHIWSDTSDELCLSLVAAKLGLLKRVYARKCNLGEATHEFMKVNHVDGDCRSINRWSLYFNDVEVCQLSVRTHKEGLEIARFATRIGYEVVGGYSKLLKYAIAWAKLQGIKKIITYCNRDLSPDPKNNFYSRQGFEFVGECSLVLKYVCFKPVELCGVMYKSNSIISRQRCQKHILMDALGITETKQNEGQLAEQLGIYQVYNSGNFKYSYDIK